MVKENLKHDLILPSLQHVEVNLVCNYFCFKYSMHSVLVCESMCVDMFCKDVFVCEITGLHACIGRYNL